MINPLPSPFNFYVKSYLFIICWFLLCNIQIFCQNGNPIIRNFKPSDYKAHAQNWDFIQDDRGVLYVANTSGILEYDGKDWNLILTSNQSTVRTLAKDSSGTIYAGAIGDMGYLAADSSGKIIFVSLVNQLPEGERAFNDIWKVFATSRGVYFISTLKIYRFYNNQFQIFKANIKPIRGFTISDEIYLFQKEGGIFKIRDTSLIQLPHTEMFEKDLGRMVIMPYAQNKLLICTDKEGFYIYNLDRLSQYPDYRNVPETILQKFTTQADAYIKYYGIYSGLTVSDNQYAVGTFGGGIVILDSAGQLIRIINKNRGLNHDIVINMYNDTQNNLWAALLEGMSLIEIQSPITLYSESSGLAGSMQATANYHGIEYVAALSGLYFLPEYQVTVENDNHQFLPVLKQKFNCWGILPTAFGLFSSGPEGVLAIEGTKVKKLENSSVIYCLGTSQNFPSGFFTGLIDGFKYYEIDTSFYKNKRDFKVKQSFLFPEIKEPIRKIVSDDQGNLWLTTHYNGILFIKFNGVKINDYTIKRYSLKHGLPQNKWNYVHFIDNRLIIASMNGLYSCTKTDGYADSLFFSKDTSFGAYLTQDTNQILQIAKYDSSMYVIATAYGAGFLTRINNQAPVWDPLPFKILPDGYMHFEISEKKIWFSTTAGLFCYDPSIKKTYNNSYATLIRKVTTSKNLVLFFGTNYLMNDVNQPGFSKFSIIQPGPLKPVLEYGSNAMNFLFSGLFYEQSGSLEYRYILEGFNREWSEWTQETKVAYTNLSSGDYRFRVKARNRYETESLESVYEFRILPPWYQTWWAYALFSLLAVGMINMIIRWRLQTIEKEKKELERLIQERTRQLSEQKDMLEEQHIQLNERTEQLEKINTIVKAINAEYQSLNLLQSILEQTRVIRGVERCAAMVLDAETGQYNFVACIGWDLKDLEAIRLTGSDIHDRYLKNSVEIDRDIYIAKGIKGRELEEKFIRYGLPQSMMIMLIRMETAINGLLIFDNYHNENAFDEQDVLLLKNLREHIRSAFIKTQMLEELKRLNQKKNEFLGIAAHDLRNPLNAIMGYVDLILRSLKADTFNKKESIEDMETILRVTRQMSHMVTELLDISAIESGKIRLDLHQENLQSIIDECEKLHKRHALQKNIQLFVEKDYQLPPVLVDRSRIMEVVDNLLSNAIKYTQPGGQVRLSCSHEGREVTTHIQDTGQGLTEDDISKVFIGFKKLSARPTGGETSTGLGLAIVKKIVELHGGRVWVNSRFGVGSTFSFSLPACNSQ